MFTLESPCQSTPFFPNCQSIANETKSTSNGLSTGSRRRNVNRRNVESHYPAAASLTVAETTAALVAAAVVSTAAGSAVAVGGAAAVVHSIHCLGIFCKFWCFTTPPLVAFTVLKPQFLHLKLVLRQKQQLAHNNSTTGCNTQDKGWAAPNNPAELDVEYKRYFAAAMFCLHPGHRYTVLEIPMCIWAHEDLSCLPFISTDLSLVRLFVKLLFGSPIGLVVNLFVFFSISFSTRQFVYA